MAFKDKIKNYVLANYPVLWVLTHEERRAMKEIFALTTDLCEIGYKVMVWSATKGWRNSILENEGEPSDPLEALSFIARFNDKGGFILRGFHHYLHEPHVIQAVKELVPILETQQKQIFLISPELKIPEELQKLVHVVEMDLPGKDDLRLLMQDLLNEVVTYNPEVQRPNAETEEKALDAALGLTTTEAQNAFALSLVTRKGIDPEVIATEKVQIVKKTGLLELISPEEDLSQVGGLEELKCWLKRRAKAFSEEARKFGLPAPRGILMVGVPGCGKSLVAKAVARTWGLPLLRFDLGRVFGSLVGESESRIRQVTQLAEAMAPVILWVDEIEKGLSGIQSSGATDSGVTARVLGTLLTWMNERRKPVPIMATANDVRKLPPEVLRKGRFDEIFFVDLPSPAERRQIFEIHLRKRGRNPEEFDIEALVAVSEGYSGSEIEEAIIAGLYTAFDEERELTTDDVLEALRETVPISTTMREDIEFLRTWARNRARPASRRKDLKPDGQRKLAIHLQ